MGDSAHKEEVMEKPKRKINNFEGIDIKLTIFLVGKLKQLQYN
tara:strand:- start:207 stop:335 length:129 start_codon:yes stop_codon:yes gene_type:complete